MAVERIDDLGDPRLADYRDLQDAARYVREGLFVAEGRQVVRRLLDGGRFRARSLLVTAPARESLRDALAPFPGLPVYVAAHQTIRGVVGFPFHRGCLAIGERGPEPPLDALLAPTGERRLLLVLEALANPDNVGGVFRNAFAFGAGGLLLSPRCADPLSRKAIRVSLGGTLRVPFARLPAWPAELARLRAAGWVLLALTPDPRAPELAELVAERPAPARLALLLGNEGEGLGSAARAAADLAAAIRMAPGVDSLNVATAAGIALHRLTAWR